MTLDLPRLVWRVDRSDILLRQFHIETTLPRADQKSRHAQVKRRALPNASLSLSMLVEPMIGAEMNGLLNAHASET